MKHFYEKNELGFAVAWIIAYVTVMGTLRGQLGDASPLMLIAAVVFTALSIVFLGSTGTWKKYGLVRLPDGRSYLYFIPLVLLCTVNLWAGVVPAYAGMGQVYAMLSMALVGWIEEFVFRGLLFRAMEKENVTRAIVVSAITFGAGHIANLLTGQATLDTLLQVAYATAIGFAFVMVFHRSGCLWPCIIAHGVINATSKLANHNVPASVDGLLTYGTALFLVIVAGGYAWYLYKRAA